MARKKSSYLLASVKTEAFSVRLDTGLKEALNKLDERIAKQAPSFTFDRAKVVEAALRKAVLEVNLELDTLQRSTGPASARSTLT